VRRPPPRGGAENAADDIVRAAMKVAGLIASGIAAAAAASLLVAAPARQTENVVLITTDGLRWQEVFSGAEEALLTKDAGVADPDARSVAVVDSSARHAHPAGTVFTAYATDPVFWAVRTRWLRTYQPGGGA